MKVSIAQIDTCACSLEKRIERMVDASSIAAADGTDLLVFPFASLTGPVNLDFPDQTLHAYEITYALSKLAKELECPSLVPVAFDIEDMPFQDLILISKHEFQPLHAMSFLDKMAASEGLSPDDFQVPQWFEFEGAKLGYAFSYEGLDILLASHIKLDAVIYVPNMSYATGDLSSFLGMGLAKNRYIADATNLGCWFIAAGSLGSWGVQLFCGSSFILAPWGEIAAQAPAFEEHILSFEIDLRSEGPLENPLTPEIYDRLLTLWNALSFSLRDFCEKSSCDHVAFLLDTSLCTQMLGVLATDALGPTHVHAVACTDESPCAKEEIEQFTRNIRLECEYAASKEEATDLLSEYISKAEALFLGSFDKTGLALELEASESFTGVLQAFGDVYRSELIQLAHLRNTISPVISETALKNVSVPKLSGLKESSSVEQRLVTIDDILSKYLEWEYPPYEIVQQGFEGELVKSVLESLHARTLLRTTAGASLVMSSKTLSELKRTIGYSWDVKLEVPDDIKSYIPSANAGSLFPDDTNRSLFPSFEATQEVEEMLGIIRDISLGPGMKMQSRGPQDPRFNDNLWGSPFSEN